jgi:branched-chain amino acid transport system substrate-binding protein
MKRRGLLLGGTGLATASAFGLARPAVARVQPIRIGWLAALTGPNSAPTLGFNRGVLYAANAINAAGGVNGRKIEVITRDTQGDPTKAVDATQEMISELQVDAIWGPTNSGESLAVTAIMTRANMPNIHPCVVDRLINPERYPNAFRIAPSSSQWEEAARDYTLNIARAKKVAVFGDTTGYGVTAADASAVGFRKAGAQVIYHANIDATQSDMTPQMLDARSAGAQAIIIWSDSTGMIARMLNARGDLGWNVPVIGHPALASGDIAKLLEKPAYWERVYAVGYRSCSYDASGKLPPHSAALVAKLAGKIDLQDTLLWWVFCGIDAVDLIADAVRATGSTAHDAIIQHWNSLKGWPGYFGSYSFSPTDHNGYPSRDVVMSDADSGRNGAFALAPGYV